MKKYRKAVSALVLRRSDVCTPGTGCGEVVSVLLVHKPRKYDAWQLPQGGIEHGETTAEAALRELHEEAGLVLSGTTVFESDHVYSYDFPPEFVHRHHPVNHGQTLAFVAMEAPSNIVVTVDQNEIDAFLWVLPEDLPRYIHRKEYLESIQKVLSQYQEQRK